MLALTQTHTSAHLQIKDFDEKMPVYSGDATDVDKLKEFVDMHRIPLAMHIKKGDKVRSPCSPSLRGIVAEARAVGNGGVLLKMAHLASYHPALILTTTHVLAFPARTSSASRHAAGFMRRCSAL